MTRTDLFDWAAVNAKSYPALDRLCEVETDGAVLLFLPGNYGVYRGFYLCFGKNPEVYRLRREGYAVGIINNYAAAKKLIFERVKYEKRQARRRKSCQT